MFESKFQFIVKPPESSGPAPLFMSAVADTKGSVEGELAIDVVETETELVIAAAIAGAKPADLELHLASDVLTIRGWRRSPLPSHAVVLYGECHWGTFSRTIVLPSDVKHELASAEYHNGILLIRLPKARPAANIPILVVEE